MARRSARTDRPDDGRTTRRRLVRALLGGTVVVAALVVALVVVIGGSRASDAPADATAYDFCLSVGGVRALLAEEGARAEGEPWETDRMVEVLADTGTPASISDDGRAGFEQLVDGLEDADGTTRAEIEEAGDLTGDRGPEGDAFDTYVEETCGDLG